jgi:hypothetical protein
MFVTLRSVRRLQALKSTLLFPLYALDTTVLVIQSEASKAWAPDWVDKHYTTQKAQHMLTVSGWEPAGEGK